MADYKPARKSCFSAVIKSRVYLWGGYIDGKTDHLSTISIYDYSRKQWSEQEVKGQHPPGYYDGACASDQSCLYTYGGTDESGCDTGCLYKLNVTSLQWEKLSDSTDEGPAKKKCCGMIEHEKKLVLFGGSSSSLGTLNEMYIYVINKGE